MAHASGTASSYLDLLDRFNTFVTTGLASGQNWTKLKDSVETGCDRNLYYRAPGLAGTDTIYTNIAAIHNTGADYYNLGFRGHTGFNTGTAFDAQPGTSIATYLLCWNTSIPYWFIANGRCAKIVAKISGVYESAYIGFITPYGSPTEYPYPLFVGGMHATLATRWSSIDFRHKAFWNPTADSFDPPVANNCSGAFLCLPGHNWIGFGNYSAGSESGNYSDGSRVWPYCSVFEKIAHPFGDSTGYTLMPLVLHSQNSGRANWGEFDGVYFISGFGNAVENIITISSVDYLVVQNSFHSSGPNPDNASSNHYAAFALV